MSVMEKVKRPPATEAPPAAPAPARSEERQALALALAARADAQRVADEAVAAAKQADDAAFDARSNLRKLEAEIAEARGGSDRFELRQLQQRQMAALCAVEDAKAEHDRLDAESDRPLAALRRAEAAVAPAIVAVLATAAPRLVAEFVDARDKALSAVAQLVALDAILGAGALVDPATGPVADLRAVVASSKQTLHSAAMRHPAGAPWRLAREALLLDADARLPD